MDMKYMQIINLIIQEYLPVYSCVIYFFTKEGGINMIKFLAKMAEKYAKATNTACAAYWWGHQPKMPKALIKKD